MSDKMKDKKKNKTIMSCSIDQVLMQEVKSISERTGASKSELMRRAIRNFCSEGQDDALVMFNMVCLIQSINEAKEFMPQEQHEKFTHYTENIMRIKGGHGNDSI